MFAAETLRQSSRPSLEHHLCSPSEERECYDEHHRCCELRGGIAVDDHRTARSGLVRIVESNTLLVESARRDLRYTGTVGIRGRLILRVGDSITRCGRRADQHQGTTGVAGWRRQRGGAAVDKDQSPNQHARSYNHTSSRWHPHRSSCGVSVCGRALACTPVVSCRVARPHLIGTR
jgi:hypothetical protein